MGQNGYYKLPDGLLIQWGLSNNSSGNKTVYLNSSFVDANYSITLTMQAPASAFPVIVPMLVSKYNSYYTMKGRYSGINGSIGDTSEPFHWIAIGRWK